jgi:hypothetical protein
LPCIQKSVRTSIESALKPQWETDKPRDELLMTYCTQTALITANTMWVEEVETCLASISTNDSNSNTTSSNSRNNTTTTAINSSDNGPLQPCYEACTTNIDTFIKLLQVLLVHCYTSGYS